MNKFIQEVSTKYGFEKASVIKTDKIEFDSSFRKYCEENLCGMYNANYSCPPICGTPEEMKETVLRYNFALVLQSVNPITNLNDEDKLFHIRYAHNISSTKFAEDFSKTCKDYKLIGCGPCALCEACNKIKGKPCLHIDKMYSCVSAYCINMKNLADECEMNYVYDNKNICFFSIILFNL